jgi:hypothetical protein
MHDEACLTLLEHLAAPILWDIDLGDTLQGHHFPAELENHPDWMSPHKLLEYIEALKGTRARANKIEEVALCDKIRAGIIRLDDQLLNYKDRFLVPRYVPFAAKMLIRARRAGLTVRGDLGVATILSGNHFMKTAEGRMAESTLIRMNLVAEMEAYALRNGLPLTRQEIEDATKAPMLGKTALAEGVFGIKRGKRTKLSYAISARHKPVGKAAKYADPIRMAREAYGKRGATNQDSVGLWTLVLSGHTHMEGSTSTPYSDVLGCGSQTNSDPFGETQSYPLNIISSVITGVHVNGADRGPRVEIPLRDDLMRAYVEEPWKINAKKLFANAIGWDEERDK